MEPNPPHRKTKTVQLALSTTERLDKLGVRGNTYNDIIDSLLNYYDWRHDAKHDMALNETEDIQQQISQIKESIVELRKDVEKLQASLTLDGE
jgi:hypothetical protein